jgi:branched-chain amino acid transport system permease protein
MDLSSLIVQLLNGLAGASSLFLVAAGLSLIFGVTRIVNFAHGSFFMVGIYVAYTLVEKLSASIGFWPALLLAPLVVGVLGALIEITLLRRIYRAPELFQLLATFALVLVIKDAVLWIWGPEELLGPRAPGLKGSVEILNRHFPSYDLFLIVVGLFYSDYSGCYSRAHVGAPWSVRQRKTVKWLLRWGSTKPGFLPPCSHSARY